MEGMYVVVDRARVSERNSFSGNKGMVHQLKLQFWGGSYKITSEDANVVASWPVVGSEVRFVGLLEPAKDGLWRVGSPALELIKPAKQAGSVA